MRAWAIALLIAACGDDEPPPIDSAVASGARVDLWYPPDRPPCGGTLAWLDGLVAREAAFLGIALPAGARIEYHYRPIGTPLPCPDGAAGCTYVDSATIYARPPDFSHELTHAVLYLGGLTPPSFFDEGLATALGGPDDADDPIDYDVPLDPLLARRSSRTRRSRPPRISSRTC